MNKKILAKDISCKCNYKFDGRKCSSNQKWNNDKCRCECKKHHICEKDYIWNPATCCCKYGEYLGIIIDDSVITCDEIIDVDAEAKSEEETKTKMKKQKLFQKIYSVKQKVSIFYLPFY